MEKKRTHKTMLAFDANLISIKRVNLKIFLCNKMEEHHHLLNKVQKPKIKNVFPFKIM